MKTRSLSLLAAFALMAISTKADTDAENCADFHGTADFSQRLILTATSNAPAGAKGKAEFITVDDNGTNYEALFVKTSGLGEGVYTVSVTDETGTNTFDLGTLNVMTVTNFHNGEDDQGENDDDQGENEDGSQGSNGGERRGSWWGMGWDNWVESCASSDPLWTNLMNGGICTNLHCFATNAFCWFTNTLTAGSGSFILPPGLTETNAGEIDISDTNGVVFLTGNFMSTSNSTITYKEVADIIPGTAGGAQGTATLTYRRVKSKEVGTFSMKVTGLPPKDKLHLTANGTKTMKVVTNGKGKLNVRSFPRMKAATILNVVATDKETNVVFRVNF